MIDETIMFKAGRVIGSCYTEEQLQVARRYQEMAMERTEGLPEVVRCREFRNGKREGRLDRLAPRFKMPGRLRLSSRRISGRHKPRTDCAASALSLEVNNILSREMHNINVSLLEASKAFAWRFSRRCIREEAERASSKPGNCDWCGLYDGRLVEGECPSCRERSKTL